MLIYFYNNVVSFPVYTFFTKLIFIISTGGTLLEFIEKRQGRLIDEQVNLHQNYKKLPAIALM